VFNIGPLELLVLGAVALIVFGPDRLPALTKDAARMLRTLRDLAQGARTQLNSELGPEFANFDLNSLNPKTAIRNALLGDDDMSSINPKDYLERALRGEDAPTATGSTVNGHGSANASTSTNGSVASSDSSAPAAPGLAEGDAAPFDPDAT
jgi:sec-independent protein translocase protein TatB